MTLDKAIEIQTIHNDHNPDFTDAEREEAHQLSIQAMKHTLFLRKYPKANTHLLLPGETKEFKHPGLPLKGIVIETKGGDK